MQYPEIDTLIDELTPCLIQSITGETFSTEVKPVNKLDLKKINVINGWNPFDWGIYLERPNFVLKKLLVKNDDIIQGLVAYEIKDGWVELNLVESAPWNIGPNKDFIGVGGHLFAIACKASFDLGFEGYTAFYAKSKLVKHYQDIYGAILIDPNSRRMIIDTNGARKLVQKYFD
ncbi:hypothetical protein BKP45_03150 [Anaerobacillus alkalidiazotrophicus]|uniref:N-acetyltransferase n=1 Tax=Anaerobacillus alkalidiazotrophicus TaxID=472963 RepID=A0A1S2MFL1_9BACI|nr:hypothetical protein BKP45_03150 [Anaerobacillus alkalidiazotrophicus]